MPVEIHGKQYVTVNERVQEFHESYPNGAIHCHIEEGTPEGVIRMSAMVCPDVENTERHFSGHAEETIGSSQINRTSALENCETSAIGRALGFLGLGVVNSIATADEVSNAIHQQNYKPVTELQKELYQEYLKHFIFIGLKTDTNNWWGSFKTEEAAEAGLVHMLKRMNAHDEKESKKQLKKECKNEDK